MAHVSLQRTTYAWSENPDAPDKRHLAMRLRRTRLLLPELGLRHSLDQSEPEIPSSTNELQTYRVRLPMWQSSNREGVRRGKAECHQGTSNSSRQILRHH